MQTYKKQTGYRIPEEIDTPSPVGRRQPGSHRVEPVQMNGILADRVRHSVARQGAESGNRTGIPDRMKERFEQSYGLPLDDVEVHYNSQEPARMGALAFTQGNRVHIAPGEKEHLGHELGHVIQQKMGRVAETASLDGVAFNLDESLEREADRMGENLPTAAGSFATNRVAAEADSPIQMKADGKRRRRRRRKANPEEEIKVDLQRVYGDDVDDKWLEATDEELRAERARDGTEDSVKADGKRRRRRRRKTNPEEEIKVDLQRVYGDDVDDKWLEATDEELRAERARDGTEDSDNEDKAEEDTAKASPQEEQSAPAAASTQESAPAPKKKGFFGAIKSFFVDRFNDAVDKRNNNEEEFRKLSKEQQLKWAIANPIAALRHNKGTNREDTKKRNEAIAKAKQRFLAEHGGEEALRKMVPHILAEQGGAAKAPAEKASAPAEKTSESSEKASAPVEKSSEPAEKASESAIKASEPAKKASAPAEKASDTPKKASDADKKKDGADSAIKKHGAEMMTNFEEGNTVGGTLSMMGVAQDLASSGNKIAEKIPGASKLGSVFENINKSIDIAKGLVAVGQGGYRRTKTTQAEGMLDKAGTELVSGSGAQLSEEKKAQLLKQAEEHKNLKLRAQTNRDMANAQMVGGGFQTVSAALKLTGAVASVSGPWANVLKYGAKAADKLGEKVPELMQNRAKSKYVNQRLGIDAYVKEVMGYNYGLNEKQAKRVVLQSMGVESGKRKEAYLHFSNDDATKIRGMASLNDDAENASRKSIGSALMKSFGLSDKAEQKQVLMSMGISREDAENPNKAVEKLREKF